MLTVRAKKRTWKSGSRLARETFQTPFPKCEVDERLADADRHQGSGKPRVA